MAHEISYEEWLSTVYETSKKIEAYYDIFPHIIDEKDLENWINNNSEIVNYLSNKLSKPVKDTEILIRSHLLENERYDPAIYLDINSLFSAYFEHKSGVGFVVDYYKNHYKDVIIDDKKKVLLYSLPILPFFVLVIAKIVKVF